MSGQKSIDLHSLGILVGHHTDTAAQTGCTVIVLPEGCVAAGEVRGGSPATREFALLAPTAAVQHVDAIVLSGGSAFGLAAADGVMRWMAEQGRGYETAGGPVPIVVGMSLFDLTTGAIPPVNGTPSHPTADDGYAAASDAASVAQLGLIGAGCGATINKWLGTEHRQPGGVVGTVIRGQGVTAAALIAVNAWGGIDDGSVRAAIADRRQTDWPAAPGANSGTDDLRGNTTIGVVITDAALTKSECFRVAQAAHGGFDRALFPSHAQPDGDAIVAVATGAVSTTVSIVETLVAVAAEQAIRSIATTASRDANFG